MWLGLDPNSQDVQELAYLTAIGDRDPKILNILGRERLMYYYEIGNGIDVIIREISSRDDPARYDALARMLATNRTIVFQEALQKADQIPTINNYTLERPIVISNEVLSPGWGPKSLEKLALSVDVPYALGVSLDPRQNVYVIRAITLWTKLSTVKPIGELLAPRLQQLGYTFYGPPAAIVIRTETKTPEESIRIAEQLAHYVTGEMYVPKTVHLINEETVAHNLHQDFNYILTKLTEILETQKKMYEEYLSLKRKQVELLEQATDSSATRYD